MSVLAFSLSLSLLLVSLPLSLGYFNSVWLVTIKGAQASARELIFKVYGGNRAAPVDKKTFFDHGCDIKLETEVAKLASKNKIGPQVLYADDTLRIEQFVASVTFTQDTFFDSPVASDFARKLARFHSLVHEIDFHQLNCQSVDIFACTREKLLSSPDKVAIIYSSLKRECSHSASVVSPCLLEAVGQSDLLLEELQMVQSLSKNIKSRKVLINWDLNPLNILIKGESKSRETLLIDYEFAHENYRFIDLGSILHGAIVQPLTGKKATQEQMSSCFDYLESNFLKHYHEQVIAVTGTTGHEDVDSLENMQVEALFGCCFIWIHYIAVRIDALFSMCPESAGDMLASEVAVSIPFYTSAKRRLLSRAPHLFEVE